jgi:hypothetical protein
MQEGLTCFELLHKLTFQERKQKDKTKNKGRKEIENVTTRVPRGESGTFAPTAQQLPKPGNFLRISLWKILCSYIL